MKKTLASLLSLAILPLGIATAQSDQTAVVEPAGPVDLVESIQPNRQYRSKKDAFVIVFVEAGRDARSVAASVILDGRKVAVTLAHDSTSVDVPSVAATSMTVPVPRGSVWSVQTDNPERTTLSLVTFKA